MAESIEGFSPHQGIIATADTPGNEALYVTPEQLEALAGMTCGIEVLTFAQGLVDSYLNRRSLWPCTYHETVSVPDNRQVALLHITPVIQIMSIKGRYTYGRRHNSRVQGLGMDVLLVSGMSGGVAQWATITTDQVEVDGSTGEMWIPSGLMLVPYTQLRVEYLAGYPQIPAPVKNAVISIVHSIQTRGLSDKIRSGAGRVYSEFKTNDFITTEAKMWLEPFVVRGLA